MSEGYMNIGTDPNTCLHGGGVGGDFEAHVR